MVRTKTLKNKEHVNIKKKPMAAIMANRKKTVKKFPCYAYEYPYNSIILLSIHT